MTALIRGGTGRRGTAQVRLWRGRVRWLARRAVSAELRAGVSLRSATEIAMAAGDAAVLVAVQPTTASGTTLLAVGDHPVRGLGAVLAGAAAGDGLAGMVTRGLAGVLAGLIAA